MAQKLMEYKDQVDENGNHSILVEKIKSLNSEWIDFLRAKAVNGDFADIDPFTVFAIFNRSSGMERRCAILKSFKELFGVLAEIPQDFDGIPLANAQKSCFYYEHEKLETIPLLWKLFDAFMNGNTTELAHSFDEAQKKKGIRWNLTMAFFWMKPNEYVPLDTRSRSYLKKHGMDIFSARKLAGERYLQLINDVKNKIDESFPSISRHAFEMNDKLEVNGLMVQDNSEPWQDELIDAMDGDVKPGVFWWHELPVGQNSTIKLLREKIDEDDSFGFYIFQEKKAVYKAVVTDFVCSEDEYAAKKAEWRKNDTQWLQESFSDFQDNDGKRKARILFYIEEFEKLEEPIPMDRFVTSKEYKKPHIANLVPFKSIIEEVKQPMESQDTNKELIDLLENKRNIILQGAPGTGKTYNTAALALSIIEPSFSISDHKAVMEEYKKHLIKIDDDGRICNDGQIGFVTFHQSLDYEDFVEGIKPECGDDSDDNNISYRVQPGIFKAICQKASEQKTTNFEDAYENLTKRLLSEGCVGDEKYLTLETSGRQSKFGISLNKKGNLKLWTGKKENEYKSQGVLTRENILRAISGEKVFEGWEGYSQSVITYLKDECGLNITQNSGTKSYILIIDEINRGNVSKIFGELISLLEADKRAGGDHPLTVTLPYSKKPFSVPSNLYIIGTMNTTDRSVGSIDYAVRRRFAFYTLKADESAIENYYKGKDESLKNKAIELFGKVRDFLSNRDNRSNDMEFDDLMVGHSYFMAESLNELELKWKYEVIPLLKEYQKDGLLRHSAKIDDILK